MSEYLCNLVIPGAAKSGTSSLHEHLGAHPLIAMSSSKEPHHFCRDERYMKGASPHNLLFEGKPGARYFGESSTGYLPSPKAAERIAGDLTNPKAIFVLRHPAERCFSHYRWRYRLGLEKRTFLEAIKKDGYGYNPETPTEFGYMAYLEFSQYSQQCPFWEQKLGIDNCLYIASEDLLKDRQKTLNNCFIFLGLPILELGMAARNINETTSLGRRPSPIMTRIAGLLPDQLKSAHIYRQARDGILKAAAPQPPVTMTAEERAFVEESLADDIAWYEMQFSVHNK
jgi:hypothetical protein